MHSKCLSACPSHCFLSLRVFILCTEHVIYLCQTLALTTLQEVTSGQAVSHVERSQIGVVLYSLVMGFEASSHQR